MSFKLLQVFHVEHGFDTESRTEPYISTTGVDCSNSVNPDQIQVLSYNKYSLLFLLVVGIEPADRFYLEALLNQMPYPLHYVSVLDLRDVSLILLQLI